MKIISFITEAPVTRVILEHLHLWWDSPRTHPPPRAGPALPVPDDVNRHCLEHADDGWPGCEEPFITYD